MSWFKPNDFLDRVYVAGLVLKGLDGLLELVTGLLLVIVTPATITRITQDLTREELSTDPHDRVANYILHSGQHLAGGGTTFAAVYLLVHGAIKLVVVFSLFRGKLWAYPFALITLGLFVVYQFYLLVVAPTLVMVGLSVFDLLVIWLVWREYQRHRPVSQTVEQT